MEKIASLIKGLTGVGAGLCCALWGGADGWLTALLTLIVLDYVSGVTAAFLNRQLSSRVGFSGLLKKVLILLLAALGALLDDLLGAGGVLRSMVFGFYAANEGLSLVENAARCGIKVPAKLLAALRQLGQEEQDGEQ